MSFETAMVATCGFCQGFLGFPTIMLAPKIAKVVADIWAIPCKERRFANTFCLLIILLFAWLIHGAIALTLIELANKHDELSHPGKIWALFVFIGAMSFSLVPGIEWRIRKRFKK